MGKLVRDKVLNNILARGSKVVWKTLTDKELVYELRNKLLEESEELDPNNFEETRKELADIQELVDQLAKVLGINKNQLTTAQKKKIKNAGSFDKRIYIDTVELQDDDTWISYYQGKFKEIKSRDR